MLKIQQSGGSCQIILESNDNEQNAVIAFLRASFDLARPAYISSYEYQPKHKLSPEEAKDIICKTGGGTKLAEMELHEGRSCRTFIYRVGDATLRVSNQILSRGDLDQIANLATVYYEQEN